MALKKNLRIEAAQVVGDSGIVVIINTNGSTDTGICRKEWSGIMLEIWFRSLKHVTQLMS
jgi:hypothetical protein